MPWSSIVVPAKSSTATLIGVSGNMFLNIAETGEQNSIT
jgi:hypothetical protein